MQNETNGYGGITRRNFLGAGAGFIGGVLAARHTGAEVGGSGSAPIIRKAGPADVHGIQRTTKLRGLFAFDPGTDPVLFAASCREWGIRQAILPPSFFASDKFASALRKEGVGLWLNVPVFYNPPYLEQHPEHYAITSQGRRAIHDWCHFVCPNRAEYMQEFVRDLRTLLGRLEAEIVSLDFIRHFVFWEMVDLKGTPASIEDGCYCSVCLSEFEKFCSEKIPRANAAAFIRLRLKRPWGDWKCSQIAAIADRLFAEIRPLAKQASYTIKTIPWKASDLDGAIRSSAGQDIPALSKNVDMVCPMAFAQILGQTPQWKQDLLEHFHTTTGKPIISYLQTDKLIRPEEITLAQFEAELKESTSDQWAGTAIFEYGQLSANPEKAALLRKYLVP